MDTWFRSVFYSDENPVGGPEAVFFALVLSFVIGQVVGWVYQRTHRGVSYSQSFTASLVVMPMLVAFMMILMKGSVSIAFGLLAVFAVVRFRNVLKDTRDTIFILWAIIQGMAVGTGQISSSIIGVVGISLAMFYLATSQYGARSTHDTILNLLCQSADGQVPRSVEDALLRHCLQNQLVSLQRRPAGNPTVDPAGVAVQQSPLMDVSYRLTMRDPQRRTELENDLSQLSGIERVSLFVQQDESEV